MIPGNIRGKTSKENINCGKYRWNHDAQKWNQYHEIYFMLFSKTTYIFHVPTSGPTMCLSKQKRLCLE